MRRLNWFFPSVIIIAALSSNAQAVEYVGRSLRNPFNNTGAGAANVKSEIEALSFALEGLVWNTRRPQAIINGQVVEKGGKIENTEILDIQKEGVKMRYKGKDFFLRNKNDESVKRKT